MSIDKNKSLNSDKQKLSRLSAQSRIIKDKVNNIIGFSAKHENLFANFIKKQEIGAAFAKIRREKILEESRIDPDRAIDDIKKVLDSLDVTHSYSEFMAKILIPFAKLAKGNYDLKINDAFDTYTKILVILGIQGINRDDLENLAYM